MIQFLALVGVICFLVMAFQDQPDDGEYNMNFQRDKEGNETYQHYLERTNNGRTSRNTQDNRRAESQE